MGEQFPDYDDFDDGTCQRCGGEGFVFKCFDGYCEDADVGCDDCTRPCPECHRRNPEWYAAPPPIKQGEADCG